MRAALLVSVPFALTALSCGKDTPAAPPPCDLPAGCLQVERVDGSCQCRQWRLESIEPVPVKYVVVGVVYAPLGNQGLVSYGHWPGDASLPATASEFGSRWRSLLRAVGAPEQVATLGPIDMGQFVWGPLAPVTAASAALVQPSNIALGVYNPFDVAPHSRDQIFVWMNPAVAATRDHAGARSVAWSCPGPDVSPFLAGWLDGSVAPPPNPYLQAQLDALDADDRAAILGYHPFYDPVGRDPSTVAADPRFELVASVGIDPGAAPVVRPVTWTPCDGPLSDVDFPVLAESAEVSYGRGETLVLQHSVLSTDAACAPQHPGLVLGTSTPYCSIRADVFVDKAFGTLLMLPTSVSAACTTP